MRLEIDSMKTWEKEILDSVKIGDTLRIATTVIKGTVIEISDKIITIETKEYGILSYPFQCFVIT